jgi:hypothetical protein
MYRLFETEAGAWIERDGALVVNVCHATEAERAAMREWVEKENTMLNCRGRD